jgi:hypothetical protein
MNPYIEIDRLEREMLQKENIRQIVKAGRVILDKNQIVIGGNYPSDPFYIDQEEFQINIDVCPPFDLEESQHILTPKIELFIENQVSVTSLYYFFTKNPQGLIIVSSYLETESPYESRGYGQALTILGQDLKETIADFPCFLEKIIISEIVDDSKGISPSVNRKRGGKGWSTFLAEQFGYEFYETRIIKGGDRVPVFRKRLR